MTIKFKTLKYKHQRAAKEMHAKIQEGNSTEDEISLFVISMIESWDFVDVESGEALPLDKPQQALDEMSLEQFAEMNKSFNEAMEVGVAAVPKVSEEQSPSGSTVSSPKKKTRRPRQSG